MWILLEVKSTEHPNFNAQLRVHGTIIEAAIDKGHHTHIVGRGKEIELRNPDGFLPLDEHLLTHAVEAGTSARFAVLVAEHDQAQLFLVTARGVRETASFEGGGIGKRVSGKEADAVQRSFFRRVAEETIDQIGDLPPHPRWPRVRTGPHQSDRPRSDGHSSSIDRYEHGRSSWCS